MLFLLNVWKNVKRLLHSIGKAKHIRRTNKANISWTSCAAKLCMQLVIMLVPLFRFFVCRVVSAKEKMSELEYLSLSLTLSALLWISAEYSVRPSNKQHFSSVKLLSYSEIMLLNYIWIWLKNLHTIVWNLNKLSIDQTRQEQRRRTLVFNPSKGAVTWCGTCLFSRWNQGKKNKMWREWVIISQDAAT